MGRTENLVSKPISSMFIHGFLFPLKASLYQHFVRGKLGDMLKKKTPVKYYLPPLVFIEWKNLVIFCSTGVKAPMNDFLFIE